MLVRVEDHPQPRFQFHAGLREQVEGQAGRHGRGLLEFEVVGQNQLALLTLFGKRIARGGQWAEQRSARSHRPTQCREFGGGRHVLVAKGRGHFQSCRPFAAVHCQLRRAGRQAVECQFDIKLTFTQTRPVLGKTQFERPAADDRKAAPRLLAGLERDVLANGCFRKLALRHKLDGVDHDPPRRIVASSPHGQVRPGRGLRDGKEPPVNFAGLKCKRLAPIRTASQCLRADDGDRQSPQGAAIRCIGVESTKFGRM